MENASKALIIAGAILLSILIIALGVYIYNMAAGATDTSSLDSLALSTFNGQFTAYEGEQLGSSVRSLITAVISSNSTNSDAAERIITVTTSGWGTDYSGSDSTTLGSISTATVATHHYGVKFSYDTTGYINLITITYNP